MQRALSSIKEFFPKMSISMPPLGVLLVEDDLPEVDHIRKALNSIGNIFWEEDIASALRAANDERLDLVLMTLDLHGEVSLDGFELFRAEKPEIPVVVLFDSETKLLAEDALEKGAMATLDRDMIDDSDYLIKMVTSYMIKANFIKKAQEMAEIYEKESNIGFNCKDVPLVDD